jgi:subtilisin family serine protease
MKNLIFLFVIGFTIPFSLTYGSGNKSISGFSGKDTTSKAPVNWFNLDRKADNFNGVSTERAYKELLKDKKSKKTVVAILDSGVDFYHEDLKDRIWTNTDEIPGNGIDDDKNGYIDDIHGWNFLGGKDGTPVNFDTYEVTRQYLIYRPKFEGADTSNLSADALKEYKKYVKIKADYEQLKKRYESMLYSVSSMKERYDKAEKIIESYLDIDTFSLARLQTINSDVDSINVAAEFLIKLKKQNFNAERLDKGIEQINNTLNFSLNPDFNPRSIIGDNYDQPDDRFYGNNLVKGPEPTHGTHVSGIVAANRNNNTGIMGIADNAEIMIVRTVPDGDERDKDVANAVFYAVDNGAQIINMSFGKGYSPYKEYVDKAFKYAEDHGVLIVHAAGNDSEDNDKVGNYPSRFYNSGIECKTWIEVGALSWKKGMNMIPGFTNYGKKNVDLFAPGFEIYSTIPEQKYRNANGTSMAAPMVTGVAALVWSYYPQLSVYDLKKILLKSTVKFRREKVILPGDSSKKVKFGKLSATGGEINAYNALKLAAKITK